MATFVFCAQIIFCVSVQAHSGRSTLCEFSKTKFVQITQYLTDWQLSKFAENQHFFVKMFY